MTPEVPVATDSDDASPIVSKVSGPVSGATLQIGIYTVQYEAEDSTGNKSPTCDVELRVQGTFIHVHLYDVTLKECLPLLFDANSLTFLSGHQKLMNKSLRQSNNCFYQINC